MINNVLISLGESSMAAHLLSRLRNKRMAAHCPGKRLPVCYHLYALEGALQVRHSDAFSAQEKTDLRLAAGLPK